MIRLNRSLLTWLAMAYGMLHATLGAVSVENYREPVAAIASIVIYVIAIASTMLFYRGIRIPTTQAFTALAAALIIPALAQSQLSPENFNNYSTWYVMGIATLMSSVLIRGHIAIAWLGVAGMTVEVLLWAGLPNFFDSGLLGAIMFTAGCTAVKLGLTSISDDLSSYERRTVESQASAASMVAAGRQRSNLLAATLHRASPMLNRIASGDALSDQEQLEARLLEAALRDEIRGRDLLNDLTRAAIAGARRRGVVVNVLDEGGLQPLNPASREGLLAQVAQALDQVSRGRVTVRAPRDEVWHITVAAFEDSDNAPRLWLRLQAPVASGLVKDEKVAPESDLSTPSES